MKAYSYFIALVLISSVLSCSKTNDEPEVVIVEPGTAVLSFPNNNEACLETTSVNTTQASVEFRWSGAANVERYELVVTNLLTNQAQTFDAQETRKTVTLTKAEPYNWKVRAIGMLGSSPTESNTWQFYLAGDASINYAPFPPELVRPITGSTVTPINGVIEVQWNCSDADTDLDRFEVYVDTADASTLVNTVEAVNTSTALEVPVENTNVYYWKVIAIDENGNTTNSGVYTFRTN